MQIIFKIFKNKGSFLGLFLVIIPFISLFYNNLYEYKFYIFLGVATSLLLLIYTYVYKGKRLFFSGKDYFLFGFCISTYISSIYSVSSIPILFYLKILIFIELYLMIKFISDKEKTILYDFIIVSGVIQSLVPIMQYFRLLHSLNPHFIVTGLFLNPNYTAIYITIPIIICLNKICNRKRIILNTCFIIIMLVGMFLCKCRGAVLSIVAATIFLLIPFRIIKNMTVLKKCVFFTTIAISMFLFIALLYSLGSKSANSRMLIWKVSGSIVKENPIFGSGMESFKTKYMFAQAIFFETHPSSKYKIIADNNYQSYNEFIRILCEQGFVGLFLIITVIFFFFKESKNILIRAVIITIAINSFLLYTFDILAYLFIIPLVIHDNDDISNNEFIKKGNKFIFFKNLPLLIISCITIYFSLKAYKEYSICLYLIKNSSIDQIVEKSKEYDIICKDKNLALVFTNISKSINSIDYNIKLFDKIIKTNICTSEMIVDFADMFLKKNNTELAEKYYLLSVNMVPGKIKPKEKLFNFYIETNQELKAKIIAEEIINSEYKIVGSKVLRTKERAKQYLINNK